MADIVCLESHKNKKAAERGFTEWRRIFRSIADFDGHTKWSDLPDEVILFFCEEGPESKHAFYDLLMRSHRLGDGHDLENQAFERLSILLNAYFFITDQARFECMRRLGWLETIPQAGKSIIEVVMESGTYDYGTLLEAPEPTPAHPTFEEDRQSRGIDRSALVRKHTPEAIRQFNDRLQGQSSATR
ncbi:MAG TPA: hypothetical protein DEO88_02030 [Syntrophobacteraceae bacterium]|nr:hypothetical protein [Syntrophobacteraceae bacterium]